MVWASGFFEGCSGVVKGAKKTAGSFAASEAEQFRNMCSTILLSQPMGGRGLLKLLISEQSQF